nr:dihydroorotate dehydrogenase [Clostridia bacterium]
ILNAIGLQNPGVDYFLELELPWLVERKATIIANVAGATLEDYIACAEKLDDSAVDMLELNISCPNVKEGGVAFGVKPESVEKITREVKAHVKNKPLIIKLSPNVADIRENAKAAEAGGADALSLINTLLGMKLDIKTRKPILANVTGGLSGPAVFPVALRMVWQVSQVTKLPLLGMGGVASAEDAAAMMIAGATVVALGTACFANPYAPIEVRDGLEAYCRENGIDAVRDIIGTIVTEK